jgi:hypothetical protein
MTRATPLAPLLLLAIGGVGCDSESDSLKGAAGSISPGGSAGIGGAGGEAGAGDAAAGAGGLSDAASTGSNDPGETGPIVGMPLGTFDTTLEGFILNYTESFVFVGGNGVQRNLGNPTTGLPLAGLSHDATAGSPTPGCLTLSVPFSVPFSGSCCDYAEVLAAVPGGQDWSGGTLHARVRVASGTFTGVAQLSATATVGTIWGTESLPSDGGWQELTLDLSNPPNPSVGFDATQIIQFGVQLHVGQNYNQATSGTVVFQIDSFSLERQIDPSDAGPSDAASEL